jgi:hypothetical protein
VVALNPTRNLGAPAAIEEAMGRPCPFLNPKLGNIINILTGMLLSKLLGPRTKTAMHFVDAAWVAREKHAAAAVNPKP